MPLTFSSILAKTLVVNTFIGNSLIIFWGNFMVEKIRELCRKQGTSLTKLEQQLGFGNGVIGRWGRSKPSYDRLEKVANALGVSVSDLTGEGQKNSPPPEERGELTDMERKVLTLFRQVPESEWDNLLMAVEIALRSKGLLQ